MELDPKLAKYIETRDNRIMKKYFHVSEPPLKAMFVQLLTRGRVVCGGRASCGSAVDPSWVEFTSWNEVVSKAKSLGYKIAVTPIKHGNGWATKAGGFWNENEYVLESEQAAA
jgi:hypothetical protein